MKRILATLIILFLVEALFITPLLLFTSTGNRVLAAFSPPSVSMLTARGTPPATAAYATYLLDADANHPLVDIHGKQRLPMASTTKIMTALLVINKGNLNQMVTVRQDAINEAINRSTAGLKVGDQIRMSDLLYALILPSGNDAAVAIADGMSGSVPAFAQQMNNYAQQLKLNDTHYINPDGITYQLPDGKPNPNHYSTASDLARLARYALQNPLLAQIVQTQEYILPATSTHQAYDWKTTDKLLSRYAGAIGVKTGNSTEAGYCLVFAAYKSGHRLIGVFLHDGPIGSNPDQRFADAAALLDWGFQLPSQPST